ncbi:MAG: PIG-L family deacetylase [Acidimicrobiales bacterium]|nr:PIG-L family deacetylase [Acidimicrobiales bacterium]
MTEPGAVASLGTILSVWAHPDDETYLAGGLMAAARANGQRVSCASATAGERGTSEPDVWPPHRLGMVRRWEASAAMAILGVTEHAVAALPDGSLAAHDAAGVEWVRGLVTEVRPDTIVTFGPDGQTFHPDHVAVHRWVTQVWDEGGRRPRLLCAATTCEHIERYGDLYEEWGVFMTEERPSGVPSSHLAVDLRLHGPLLDQKLAALRAMATQTAPAQSLLGPDLYSAMSSIETFVDAAPATLTGTSATRSGPGRSR